MMGAHVSINMPLLTELARVQIWISIAAQMKLPTNRIGIVQTLEL